MNNEKQELSLSEKIKKYPTLIYSRVVWWLAPTVSFNDWKAEEFKRRKTFKVKK